MKKKIATLLVGSLLLAGVLAGCSANASKTEDSVDTAVANATNTSKEVVEKKSENTEEKTEEKAEEDSTLNQAKVIHVAYQGSDAYTWLEKRYHWLEDEFKEDGIEVQFEQFLSGPPMIEAMTSDSIDFGNIGDMPPINARGNGVDVKIIVKTINTPFSNALVVPNGSDVKQVSDLKGKQVATQLGSSGHHFIALLLDQAGLSLEDIDLVNMSGPDMVNAIAANQVDAVVTWEPYGSQVVNQGTGSILIDSTGIKQNTGTWITRNAFAKENPELTARFIKVWLKYLDLIAEDREAALEVISEESGYAKEDIQRSILEGLLVPEFTDYDYEQEQLTKDFLVETGTLLNDYDINDLYDFSYLERAKELYEADKNQ